jgi:hypothetical protein
MAVLRSRPLALLLLLLLVRLLGWRGECGVSRLVSLRGVVPACMVWLGRTICLLLTTCLLLLVVMVVVHVLLLGSLPSTGSAVCMVSTVTLPMAACGFTDSVLLYNFPTSISSRGSLHLCCSINSLCSSEFRGWHTAHAPHTCTHCTGALRPICLA